MKPWSKRGHDFEKQERSGWVNGEWESLANESAVRLESGRRGRIDLLVELDDSQVVIEIKATDWDVMAPHRVRPNLLRHIRQLRRYTNALAKPGEWLHPAIVYPRPPADPERKLFIEGVGIENFVQIVWREDGADA